MKKLLFSAAALIAIAGSACAQPVNGTGQITDNNGAVAPFTFTVTIDTITISAITVTPSVAAKGTPRTLVVSGSSSAGGNIQCTTLPVLTGVTFTPISSEPAGTCGWNFVY